MLSIEKKIFYGQVSNNGHPNGRDMENNNNNKKTKKMNCTTSYVIFHARDFIIIKIGDNLYISPNHVSLSYIWFCHNFYLFSFVEKPIWSRSIKDVLSVSFEHRHRTALFLSISFDLSLRVNAPTTPSPTFVLLTFTFIFFTGLAQCECANFRGPKNKMKLFVGNIVLSFTR